MCPIPRSFSGKGELGVEVEAYETGFTLAPHPERGRRGPIRLGPGCLSQEGVTHCLFLLDCDSQNYGAAQWNPVRSVSNRYRTVPNAERATNDLAMGTV